MPIEDMIGEVMPENFTLTDRTELIRHGIQLEKLSQDMQDLKVLFNATLDRADVEDKEKARVLKQQDSENEKRIRCLEDDRLEMQTQLNTFKWVASLAGPGLAGVMEILIHIFWK